MGKYLYGWKTSALHSTLSAARVRESHKRRCNIHVGLSKGRSVFNPNIANVGLEGQFYTEGDDSQVDDLITRAESQFSDLVRELPTTTPGRISHPVLPRLIAHPEVRTRHIRETLLQAGDFFLSALVHFMEDDSVFIPYLEREFFGNDLSMIRESLSNELATRRLPEAWRGPLLNLAPSMMRQHLAPMLPLIAARLRAELPQRLRDGAKAGHIRSLKESISPEVKAGRYQSLNYFVLETPDSGVILGDSIVLFDADGPRRYKTFLEKDDRLVAVFLPISSTRVVVGTQQESPTLPIDLREALARCSLEYFIAAEKSESMESLKEKIGTNAFLIARAEVEAMVKDLLSHSGNTGGTST